MENYENLGTIGEGCGRAGVCSVLREGRARVSWRELHRTGELQLGACVCVCVLCVCLGRTA